MAMPTGQASPCQACVDGASRFCATIHSTGCSMCSCSPGPSPLLPSQPLLPPTPVACLAAAAPPPPHRAWTHRSPPAANSLDVIYGVTIFSALLSLLGSLFIIVTYHSIYGSRVAAQLCAAHVARLTRRRTPHTPPDADAPAPVSSMPTPRPFPVAVSARRGWPGCTAVVPAAAPSWRPPRPRFCTG